MNANHTKEKRIHELVGMLKKADIAYYRDDDPVMTDREYDRLFDELKVFCTSCETDSLCDISHWQVYQVGEDKSSVRRSRTNDDPIHS